jgi:hypothetical protein
MIRVGWPRGLAFNLMFSSIVVGADGSDTATQAVRVHFYDDPCFGGDQVLWFTGATTFAGWGLDPREGITNCAAPFGSANNRSSGIPSSDAPTAMASRRPQRRRSPAGGSATLQHKDFDLAVRPLSVFVKAAIIVIHAAPQLRAFIALGNPGAHRPLLTTDLHFGVRVGQEI